MIGVAIRVLAAVFATLFVARFGVGIAAWRAANKLEQPHYRVLQTLGSGVEIREYDPYVVAEATLQAPKSMTAGTGAGFQACAGYIFGGKNRRGQKFAMTSPVRMSARPNVVKVSFVMARNESLKTLPVPTESSVKLRSIPAHKAAFVRFSGGRPTEKVIERKRHILDAKLTGSQFRQQPDAETLVYGYHDPFITPTFLRRNEVGYFVESAPLRK